MSEQQQSTESTEHLSGTELDAACAREIMGWKDDPEPDLSGLFWEDTAGRAICKEGWQPSVDLNAAREVVLRVGELVGHLEYFRELCELIYPESEGDDPMLASWRILTATPEQLCKAALAAVRAGRGE